MGRRAWVPTLAAVAAAIVALGAIVYDRLGTFSDLPGVARWIRVALIAVAVLLGAIAVAVSLVRKAVAASVVAAIVLGAVVAGSLVLWPRSRAATVVALDAETGAVRWVAHPDVEAVLDIDAGGDEVQLTGLKQLGRCGRLAFRRVTLAATDGDIVADTGSEPADVHPDWQPDRRLVTDDAGNVFEFDKTGHARAQDATTGSIAYRFDAGGPPPASESSIELRPVGDIVLLLRPDLDRVYALDADRLRWAVDLPVDLDTPIGTAAGREVIVVASSGDGAYSGCGGD